MRRENRNKNKINSNSSVYITGGVLLLAIVAFVIAFVVYSNKLDSDSYILDSEYLSKYNNGNTLKSDNTTSASSSIGKTVEESEKNSISNNTTVSKNNTIKSVSNNVVSNEKGTSNTKASKNSATTKKQEKDPTFKSPLEGEIIKEFAKDNLIYSETLKEWTTHYGVDIKAERATVVKAAAEGTVKYIKNDPRFGLTIIIEHANGFETRYANLLTTEFVSEGEEVKSGQTIGTVGDSAVYEIVDESHLHFEILKNNENVNPSEYIKF